MAAEEVEALQHIFGDDCRWQEDKGTISIRLDDRGLFGSGVWLSFTLSEAYPKESPTIDVTSRNMRLDGERESLLVAAREAITLEQATLYDCVLAANELLGDIAAEREQEDAVSASTDIVQFSSVEPASFSRLSRKLIYSHHIIAESKRMGLRELSVALNVTALVKIGWPGVIVLEGETNAVELFVSLIQKWRWKQLVVRGEQEVDIPEKQALDSFRALPKAFVEYGPSQMSAIARTCRDAGLDDLFRRVLK